MRLHKALSASVFTRKRVNCYLPSSIKSLYPPLLQAVQAPTQRRNIFCLKTERVKGFRVNEPMPHTEDEKSQQALIAEAKEAFENAFGSRGLHKVLLVTPPDGEEELFRYSTALRKRYPNYPPYGLGIIAKKLEDMGVEVEVINLNHSVLKAAQDAESDKDFSFTKVWQSSIDKAISQFKPQLLGFTCMFTMTHTSLKRVIKHASSHNIPIAVGGVHVTNDASRVLDDIPEINFAFLYEADIAIEKFVSAVRDRNEIINLKQLIIRHNGHNLDFLSMRRPQGEELDVTPSYHLLSIESLSQYGVIGNFHGFKAPGTRFATALSNRGCRAQCTFCSVRNFNGKSVRQRSVESVLNELQMLHDQYGVEHITWLDDDLLKDEKRTLELFNGIVQRRLNITWDATNGILASSCTEEVAAAMAESGCIGLNIGMESGNPDILRSVKKPGTVDCFQKAAEVLRKHETIHARVFLMIGFPNETFGQISDTINVARNMDLDWAGITILQPLPNTPIYDSMIAQGLIQNVGTANTRFNSGGYGKQDQIDMGVRLSNNSFAEAFSSIDMNNVPTAEQLDDIWFFMNYHLNFHRLFFEKRPGKLRQQLQHLKTLSDVISPEHGMALYFTGYLQYKLYDKIDESVIQRLREKLYASEYWSSRFAAFGLSLEDLINKDFMGKQTPSMGVQNN